MRGILKDCYFKLEILQTELTCFFINSSFRQHMFFNLLFIFMTHVIKNIFINLNTYLTTILRFIEIEL